MFHSCPPSRQISKHPPVHAHRCSHLWRRGIPSSPLASAASTRCRISSPEPGALTLLHMGEASMGLGAPSLPGAGAATGLLASTVPAQVLSDQGTSGSGDPTCRGLFAIGTIVVTPQSTYEQAKQLPLPASEQQQSAPHWADRGRLAPHTCPMCPPDHGSGAEWLRAAPGGTGSLPALWLQA